MFWSWDEKIECFHLEKSNEQYVLVDRGRQPHLRQVFCGASGVGSLDLGVGVGGGGDGGDGGGGGGGSAGLASDCQL